MLKNLTAVVTGGAGILCREFCFALANEGANVVVLGRTKEKAEAVAEEIRKNGGSAIAVRCDVTDKESVKAAKKEVNDKFGSVSILINGAGGNHPRGNTTKEIYEKGDETNNDIISFFNLDVEGFRYVLDLNITGTFIPTQVFAEDMIKNGSGNIINVSSMSAYHPMTKVSAYSAAKAGVTNLTEFLAVHFAQSGIRVNAIAPGFFETEQNKNLLRNPDGSLSERSIKIINNTPMKRFGVPKDLTGTLLWLADDEKSGFVTGVCVPVDGGFNAYSGV